jgi:tetratricopeptide (TPR) repeat protein
LTSGGDEIKVWDAETGQEVLTLDKKSTEANVWGGKVSWSPDGRQLVTTGEEQRIKVWDATTWQEVSTLPEPGQSQVAWSLDGWRLASLGTGLKVWDVATRQEILALYSSSGPEAPYCVHTLAWGPDGKGLMLLGRSPQGDTTVKILDGCRRDTWWPSLARTCNDFAWYWAVSADARFRDPARAVEFARRAVDLAPHEERYWTTLGVAHYRMGDWNASTAALEKALELRPGGENSCHCFFLAMAAWQRGNQGQAHQWYDQAVQWMEKRRPQDEELLHFRAEASELLGIKDKKE